MDILAICSDNSMRSILLESLLNALGGGRITAHSAGMRVAEHGVHPLALQVLRDNHHDVQNVRAKTLAVFDGAVAPRFHTVIWMRDKPRPLLSPGLATPVLFVDWPLGDPQNLPANEQLVAVRNCYTRLRRRVATLMALPLESYNTRQLRSLLNQCGAL